MALARKALRLVGMPLALLADCLALAGALRAMGQNLGGWPERGPWEVELERIVETLDPEAANEALRAWAWGEHAERLREAAEGRGNGGAL